MMFFFGFVIGAAAMCLFILAGDNGYYHDDRIGK